MSYIKKYIEALNAKGRKALSVFLTAGFPSAVGFTDLAKSVLDAGADMIEIGIPFSDPLADGPVIQQSSIRALSNGVDMKMVFRYAEAISAYSSKPVILMGYANPVSKYGTGDFFSASSNSGVKGVIIPDVPIEEYDDFYKEKPRSLDAILLAAPTSDKKRIIAIDKKSSGFVYCVSMKGTTGNRNISGENEIVQKARTLVTRNKMMTGFGISKPEDITNYSPYCDGVIVGSAIINELNIGRQQALQLVNKLSAFC